jgi:hypothetical protein
MGLEVGVGGTDWAPSRCPRQSANFQCEPPSESKPRHLRTVEKLVEARCRTQKRPGRCGQELHRAKAVREHVRIPQDIVDIQQDSAPARINAPNDISRMALTHIRPNWVNHILDWFQHVSTVLTTVLHNFRITHEFHRDNNLVQMSWSVS